jgi:hypothetical protein
METPLFTTGDGRADEDTTAATSGDHGRMETPLFTTQGRDPDATFSDDASGDHRER